MSKRTEEKQKEIDSKLDKIVGIIIVVLILLLAAGLIGTIETNTAQIIKWSLVGVSTLLIASLKLISKK